MSYQIHIQNEQGYDIEIRRLQIAASTVLQQHNIAADSILTVVITSNNAVRNLNRLHRRLNAPTDVLSFPADPLPAELADEGNYLGDIIIAHDYALAQAQRLDHDFHESLALLVIHGVLHLLGYDHVIAPQKAEMWTAQANALKALGLSEDLVPGLEGN